VRGLKWNENHFRSEWQDAYKSAGFVEQRTFHDMRGTALTELFNHGATDAEVMALSGHVSAGRNRVLEKYAPPTKEQALAAMRKFQHSWVARLLEV